MLARLIEVLERRGLVSAEAVERLTSSLPFKQITEIQNELQSSLRSQDDIEDGAQGESSNPFNFIASAAFRGDTGCSTWRCHCRKAQILARYAACFCDRVIVPLDLRAHHEGVSQSEQRYALGRGLLGVLEMRPVIDSGIALNSEGLFLKID